MAKPPGSGGNGQRELERQAAELAASNEALRQLRAEDQKNQAALQHFRTALDHSADAIFLIDRASLRFIDANSAPPAKAHSASPCRSICHASPITS